MPTGIYDCKKAKQHFSDCQCASCRAKRGKYSGKNNPMYGKKPWNKDLTKETDERVARSAKKLKGRQHTDEHKRRNSEAHKGKETWNKNLTKEVDERLRELGEKIRKAKRGKSMIQLRHKTNCSCCICKYSRGESHPQTCKCPFCEAKKGSNKGENNSNWKSGISKLPYPFKFNKRIKFSIRQRDNHICQFCGSIIGYSDGRKHPIHHIDYDKQNIDEYNLIVLCNQCNAKANFDREKWQFLFKILLEIQCRKHLEII